MAAFGGEKNVGETPGDKKEIQPQVLPKSTICPMNGVPSEKKCSGNAIPLF